MSTLQQLHKDHQDVFIKINLLEEALVNFLNNRTAENMTKTFEEQLAFLDAFEHGIKLHFEVEEKAVFPEMIKMGATARALVDELMIEHASISGKAHMTMQTSRDWEERMEILRSMLRELTAHAQKEELQAFPLVKTMEQAQLGKIDQDAKLLGYAV